MGESAQRYGISVELVLIAYIARVYMQHLSFNIVCFIRTDIAWHGLAM